jgi:hypothetical protein
MDEPGKMDGEPVSSEPLALGGGSCLAARGDAVNSCASVASVRVASCPRPLFVRVTCAVARKLRYPRARGLGQARAVVSGLTSVS